MKIRTAFVSNSSSSSFIAFIDKDASDKALQSLKENERQFIEMIIKTEKQAFGRQLVSLYSADYSGDCYYGEYPADEIDLQDFLTESDYEEYYHKRYPQGESLDEEDYEDLNEELERVWPDRTVDKYISLIDKDNKITFNDDC